MGEKGIEACVFDVFGTVVDWRGSVTREGEALGRAKGIELDWERFARNWRALYQPAMEKVRSGGMGFVKLDVLHRGNLVELLERHGIDTLSDGEIDDFNRAWHRLDPWPDVVEGLTRLKRHLIIATLSNGNVALIVNMAKRAGLPWDTVLGAEVARHYKPQPEAYLNAVDLLGLAPEEVLMVAAHNSDLVAAAKCGLSTAFVARPGEYGVDQDRDFEAAHHFDFTATDFCHLADQLGCP